MPSFLTEFFPKEMFAQPRYWMGVLLVWALGLLATGFVLEHGFGVLPCEMCWWQRYGHMAIAGFAAAGLLLPQRRLKQAGAVGIGLAALVTLGVACWQFAAQHGWLPFPAQCTSSAAQTLADPAHMLEALKTIKIVPCDRETFKLFGLSLAGWDIPVMAVVLYVTVRGGRKI